MMLKRGTSVRIAIVAFIVGFAIGSNAHADLTYNYVGQPFNVSLCTGAGQGLTCIAGPISATVTFKNIPVNFTGSNDSYQIISMQVGGLPASSAYCYTDLDYQPSVNFVNGVPTSWYFRGYIGQDSSCKSIIASTFTEQNNNGTVEDYVSYEGQAPHYYGVNYNSPGAWTLVSDTNILPVASNEQATTHENLSVSINLAAGASGSPTSATLLGTPIGGTVNGFPGTNVSFSPTPGFIGTASFQFTVSSNQGTSNNTATATITVLPDPPNPVPEMATTTSGTPVMIDLTKGVAGNQPTSAALVGTPVNGSVTGFPATTVTFTPTGGFVGTGRFQFSLSNAGGISPYNGTAQIEVTKPAPPVAVSQYTSTKANTPVTINLANGASGDPTSAALVAGSATGGTATGFPATSITFTPNKGYQGTASFQFTLGNAGGTSNTATTSIIVGKPPAPHISLNGVDITANPSQAVVVVGQPTQLSVAAPNGVSSQQWTVPGNPILSYNLVPQASPTEPPPPCAELNPNPVACAIVTPLPTATLKQPQLNFYWTIRGNYNVTYTYTLSDGIQEKITADIAVVGPTSPNVSLISSSVTDILDNSKGVYPHYGNYSYISCGNVDLAIACVLFQATANLPLGVTGTFQWVQIITNDAESVSYGGALMPCTNVTGLDNNYPYGVLFGDQYSPMTYDAPATPLLSKYSTVSRQFAARLYLEWTSSIIGSIPVPLGNLNWSIGATALQNKKAGVWVLQGLPKPPVVQKFNPVAVYPQWNTVVLNVPANCP